MPPERELQQLTSWKEIADYLGVSLRTAQTWEREQGLPVQRMPGEKGRVTADTAELERWRRSTFRTRSWSSNPAYLRIIAVTLAVLLLALLAYQFIGYLGQHRREQAASFRIGRRSLTVLDSKGMDIWRKAFPEPLESADYSDASLAVHRKVAFADIEGDGTVETLFVYSPLNSFRDPGALYCFSGTGDERWSFAPARTSAGNGSGGTHVINDLLVAQPHGETDAYILLLDCQLPAHSAKLFLLSPRGEILATFAHEGHLGMLETADVDGCGREEILMGGFASERHEAELIVLEMPRKNSASSAGETRPVLPLKLKEKAVIAFPRTCVNQKLEESNRIAHIVNSGDVLTVVVSELGEDPSVEVTYQLDRKLQVKDVWFSDALRNLHRTLRTQGVLDHELTADEIGQLKKITRLPPHTLASIDQ
ncbi:MAG: hypothetical protein ROO76_13310 [Terriglobia bacterium]|jgi:hypothetical protein|nr:hypothetical protein [Terriglobia bacterium]